MAAVERAYLEAKKEVYNGGIAWAKTEEREKDFYYSEYPVMIAKNVFVFLIKL